MSIIERIVLELNNRQIMQKDFCAEIGIGTSTFSTWKSRNSIPPIKQLKLICEYFGWKFDEILLEVENQDVPIEKSKSNSRINANRNTSELEKATTELITCYNSLSLSGKARVMQYVADVLKEENIDSV